jgi:hypothetical protein
MRPALLTATLAALSVSACSLGSSRDVVSPRNDASSTLDAGCGELDQPCCFNFTCNQPTLGCVPGVSFSPPGTCQHCGNQSEVCCPADGGIGTCGTGLTCHLTVDQGAFCSCGNLEEACCANFTCNNRGLACLPGTSSSPPGTCTACGDQTEVCCPGDGGIGWCNTGLTCSKTVDQGSFCQ